MPVTVKTATIGGRTTQHHDLVDTVNKLVTMVWPQSLAQPGRSP
jgi:hypothetical protein